MRQLSNSVLYCLQAELEKKERMDMSDDDKLAKQMEIQRQHQLTVEGGGKQRSEATNLERTDKTATVTFGLKMNKTVAKPLPAVPKFDTADSIQAPVSKVSHACCSAAEFQLGLVCCLSQQIHVSCHSLLLRSESVQQ